MEEDGWRRHEGDPRRPLRHRLGKERKDAKLQDLKDKDYDRNAPMFENPASVYAPRSDRRGYRGEDPRRIDRGPRAGEGLERGTRKDRPDRVMARPHSGTQTDDRSDASVVRSDHRPTVQIVTRPGGMKAPEASSQRTDNMDRAELRGARPPETSGGKGGAASHQPAKKKPQFNVPTPGPPFVRCRFMDEDWRLCDSEVSHHLTESSDFCVVCAVGSAGAGRSTVLSVLLSPFLVGADSRAPGLSQSNFKAPLGIRTSEAFLSGEPSLTGVDMCISTADRLLLLDAQPLFDNLTSSPDSDLKSELYLMIFLASICHTLVVVTDTVVEVHLWKFLRQLAMLKSKVPNLATFLQQKQAAEEPPQPIQEALPRMLVVFNNLNFEIEDGVEVPELYEPVQNFLKHCEWKAAPSIDCMALPPLPGKSCHELLCSDRAASAGLSLRQHLFREGHPRGRFGTEGLQLTEKQWLHHVLEYWDFVQNHADVQAYFDVLMAGGFRNSASPDPKS